MKNIEQDANRFEIDFFEFSFLVTACIPPRPIARTFFWHKVIDKYYHKLSGEERVLLYDWVNQEQEFKNGLSKLNSDCLLFNERYDPSNQYKVTTNFNGIVEISECFLSNNQYHTGINQMINSEYIMKVESIIISDYQDEES